VLLFIKSLFKLIFIARSVPDDFARGITIPILKDRCKTVNLTHDDFRGITINPVLSKIFECCLLSQITNYLCTDRRQFGFKKGTGCSDAINMVKLTTDYFVSSNSTVNIGVLDLSKAFDKVNHFGLLLKLMKNNLPSCIVQIFANWFSKNVTQVVWNGVLSVIVSLECGVRQGGVISPSLFSLYVDDLLLLLASCKLGCFVNSRCVNSFMYADDIILLSISISDMQKLVKICIDCLTELDLPINFSKSNFLRVGPRHDALCSNITYNQTIFEWVKEIKYLGVYIVGSKCFYCDYSNARKKFFRAFNAIYGRVGDKNVVSLLISLLSTVCTPVLLHGIDATYANNYELKRLCNSYDRAFMKIFNTFNSNIIASCQWYSNCLNMEHQIDLHRLKYLRRVQCLVSIDSDNLFNCFGTALFDHKLMKKYDINYNDSVDTITHKIVIHFEGIIQKG
jgi:hypothetical protein